MEKNEKFIKAHQEGCNAKKGRNDENNSQSTVKKNCQVLTDKKDKGRHQKDEKPNRQQKT